MQYGGYILAIIIVLVLLTGMAAQYLKEKRNYNNGVCPKCGHRLYHFDTDSQGGWGYVCKNCGYTTWVSYNVDK